jgi:hypothetical protein
MMQAIVETFVILIQAIVQANGNKLREEIALMAAEEKLSRIRAKAKFG